MSARRTSAGLVAGLLLAALVGCGRDEPDPDPDPEPEAASVPVELRAVLATSKEPPPDSLVMQQFNELDCAAPPAPASPTAPTAACDAVGVKYSLEPAAIVGGIESAEASDPDAGDGALVTVSLDEEATAAFAELTDESVTGLRQVAVVLDGQVLAAPMIQEPITDGRLQIVGGLTEESAKALADRLAGRA